MRGSMFRASLVLVSIFAVGVVAGVFLERLHSVSDSVTRSKPGADLGFSGAAVHAAAMSSLERALQLDREQVGQIHKVFEKHQGAVQESWEHLRPSLGIAMEKVHREVADLLNAEQRQAFHDWLEMHGGGVHQRHHGPSGDER